MPVRRNLLFHVKQQGENHENVLFHVKPSMTFGKYHRKSDTIIKYLFELGDVCVIL